MQIELANIIVTQNNLRDLTQVEKMVQFVKAGGRFTKDARLAQSLLAATGRGVPPPIHIAIVDSQMYLHDGHHRAVATLLGGRTTIDESECEFGHYSRKDYLLPNPAKGWFTPFNLKTECRLPQFYSFKQEAMVVYISGTRFDLDEFIRINRKRYVEPRHITTVQQLTEVYLNVRR